MSPDATAIDRIETAAALAGSDPATARRTLCRLADDAIRRGDVAAGARATYHLARVQLALGEATDALVSIDDAQRLWRQAGDLDAALRANLGRMSVLIETGHAPEAVVVGNAALHTLRERPRTDSVAAATHENLAIALRAGGRYVDALRHLDEAIRLHGTAGASCDAMRTLASRATTLIDLGRPDEAVRDLDAALRTLDPADHATEIARCHSLRARAWIDAGRFIEAVDALALAEDALTSIGDPQSDSPHHRPWADAQVARAECLALLNMHEEALDLYALAAPSIEAACGPRERARADLGRARAHAALGRHRTAAPLFADAIDAYTTANDAAMAAIALLAAAEADQDPDDRLVHARSALGLLRDVDRLAPTARAHLLIAEILIDRDHPEARHHLDQAEQVSSELGLPDLDWRVDHQTARLLRREHDSVGAEARLRNACATVDRMRAAVATDAARQHFGFTRRGPHDELIDLLLAKDRIDEAFEMSEHLRSRGVLELLRAAPDCNVRHQPARTAAALSPTYDALVRNGDRLTDDLQGDARRIAGMASAGPAVPPPPPVSAGDPTDTTALLSFHLLGNELVAFVSLEGTVQAHRKVTTLHDVQRIMGRLGAQWRRFQHPHLIERHAATLHAATQRLLAELHRELLAPLVQDLPPTDLVIAAPSVLSAVPWAALHDGERHLIEERTVRLTPSGRADNVLRSPAQRRRSVVAFGVGDRAAPSATAEAREVGAVWPDARVFTGGAATATQFLTSAPQHDVVHLAGHGLFRPDAPHLSAIRLADRWVTAAELSGLELHGQTVVLSVCDSGRQPDDRRVSEVMGLPRALLGAGAGAALVNLWSADDATATTLMTSLHRNLADGQPAARALRVAQLDAMRCNAHPYHWAGTVLVGGRETTPAS